MSLAYEIQTLQITLSYSRLPSLAIRLLFIQIQFSGNPLDLILETGENDTVDMFIGIIYMYIYIYIYIYRPWCVCLYTHSLTSVYLLIVGVGYGYT